MNSMVEKLDQVIGHVFGSIPKEPPVYTKNDLNKKVNEEETLLQYIRNTEKDFGLPVVDLSLYNDAQLNEYVCRLDTLWEDV